MTVKTLRPIANGVFNGNVYDQLGFANPVTAWVDESDQLDTTFLYPDLVVGGANFPCTAYTLPAGETISNVRTWVRHQEQAPFGDTTSPEIYNKNSALFYEGTHFNNAAITNDFTDWPQNPDSLAQWTQNDVNNSYFGFFGRTNRRLGDPITYDIWAEVTSGPAGQYGKAFIGSNFYLTLPVGIVKQKPNKLRALRMFRARILV
jgi:hypothetical protein